MRNDRLADAGKTIVAPGWRLEPDDAAKQVNWPFCQTDQKCLTATELTRMQKQLKKTKKRQKRTQYMCGKMLCWLRKDMKFEPRDMCDTFMVKRRTYQDYEANNRGIPAELATRIRERHQRNRDLTNGIGDRVDAASKRGKV